MKRYLLIRYTGPTATNLAQARRVARKIRGTLRQGQCVLVDCENVKISPEFKRVMLAEADPHKVRFCGLPLAEQDGATDRPASSQEGL